MTYRFRAEAAAARVAIYEASDDLPWSDPFTYRSRVLFHSDLQYPARVQTVTGSVTLSAGTQGATPAVPVNRSYTLFAHNLDGIPLLEGKILGIGSGGVDVPICGSLPVQTGGSSGLRARWIAIGADATNVYLHEQYNDETFGGGALASLTIDYEIHVLDWLL